ncbi:MAG: T9SS type A sorting domain-containing protein, partial [Bacteroidota bacterium]
TLVMPARNTSLRANLMDMPDYRLNYEQIMGANHLKNVYHFLPVQSKGAIWFFHGTSGSASVWVRNTENRSMVNAAIAAGYGVVITEAEESTLDRDLNGDGKLRWQTFPADTINGIDYLNLRIILDTLKQRGLLATNTPLFSVGMSNGGAFSASVSELLPFSGGVSYCAPGARIFAANRSSPFAFRMAKFDDNEQVGPEGNYTAFQHDAILADRGICHDYLLQDRQPLYPERFARIPGVSLSQSNTLYEELVANNHLSTHGFLVSSATIVASFQAQPANYPALSALTLPQRREFLNQLKANNAEHNFFSGANQQTLTFFESLCNVTTNSVSPIEPSQVLFIYPNPFNAYLEVKQEATFTGFILTDLAGRYRWEGPELEKVDFSNLSPGVYFITAFTSGGNRMMQRLVKQ